MRVVLVGITLLVIPVAIHARADEDPEPPGDLHVAIRTGIRMLEKKEYQRVLETFMVPDELKSFTKDGGLAKFAEEFGQRHAATLLSALKFVKNAKPTWEMGGKKATFALKGQFKDIPNNRIVFIKIDRRWCIQND